MSYLPPDEAGFYEAVQVYFTEATDRMALFGARDQQLLQKWKQEGRSAQIVCRGIREAVESYGTDDPPRSLSQCEPFVDDQWEQLRERAVGGHGAEETQSTAQEEADSSASTLFGRVQEAIEEAGRSSERKRWRKAYRQAWRELNEIEKERSAFSFEELEVVDQALIDAYLDVLEDEERRAVEESIGAESSNLLQSMSPAAKHQHLHVKRKRELIERYGLLDVFDVIG